MKLYLNSASDYSITDEAGGVLTLEEARKVWEGGFVVDCNLAFKRLAQSNWDLEAVKRHYAENRWGRENFGGIKTK